MEYRNFPELAWKTGFPRLMSLPGFWIKLYVPSR